MKFSAAIILAFIGTTAVVSAAPVTTNHDGDNNTIVNYTTPSNTTTTSLTPPTPTLNTTTTDFDLIDTLPTPTLNTTATDFDLVDTAAIPDWTSKYTIPDLNDPANHVPRVVVYRDFPYDCHYHIDYIPNWVDDRDIFKAMNDTCYPIRIRKWRYKFDTYNVGSQVEFKGTCPAHYLKEPCMDREIKKVLETDELEWLFR